MTSQTISQVVPASSSSGRTGTPSALGGTGLESRAGEQLFSGAFAGELERLETASSASAGRGIGDGEGLGGPASPSSAPERPSDDLGIDPLAVEQTAAFRDPKASASEKRRQDAGGVELDLQHEGTPRGGENAPHVAFVSGGKMESFPLRSGETGPLLAEAIRSSGRGKAEMPGTDSREQSPLQGEAGAAPMQRASAPGREPKAVAGPDQALAVGEQAHGAFGAGKEKALSPKAQSPLQGEAGAAPMQRASAPGREPKAVAGPEQTPDMGRQRLDGLGVGKAAIQSDQRTVTQAPSAAPDIKPDIAPSIFATRGSFTPHVVHLTPEPSSTAEGMVLRSPTFLPPEELAERSVELNRFQAEPYLALDPSTSLSELRPSSPGPRVLEARTIPQLAEDLLHQIEDAGQGELKGVELRLDPPELGKVNVRISLAGDEVRVVFSAAQGGAREAIEGALPRLREQLEAIGLTLQDAQVGDQDRKDSRQDRSVNEAAESADLEGELGAEPIVKKPSERRLDLLA